MIELSHRGRLPTSVSQWPTIRLHSVALCTLSSQRGIQFTYTLCISGEYWLCNTEDGNNADIQQKDFVQWSTECEVKCTILVSKVPLMCVIGVWVTELAISTSEKEGKARMPCAVAVCRWCFSFSSAASLSVFRRLLKHFFREQIRHRVAITSQLACAKIHRHTAKVDDDKVCVCVLKTQ